MHDTTTAHLADIVNQCYPLARTKFRSGKQDRTVLFYDKPVVAIINGGVRSGKELVAFSLKKTGRAKLVGERTAGAVVAGQLFDIDSRCSLYLAVAAGDVGGEILEGVGVSPDVTVPSSCTEEGKDRQRQAADELLRSLVNAPPAVTAPATH